MKNLVIVLSLISFSFGHSQESIKMKIGDFSTVKVFDLINVEMIQSTENRLEISGKNRNDVEVVNNNGTLKIRMDLEESYDGNDTHVKLYFTTIDVIDGNEGANIVLKQAIEQKNIEIKAQEGAEITAEINTNNAKMRAVTGGIINASGTSNKQEVTIFTGGIFNGKNLITKQTAVSINAAGEANIHATDYVEAKVRAGGDIYVYGNPKTLDETKVLGGDIKRM